jgi:hypothetical protein
MQRNVTDRDNHEALRRLAVVLLTLASIAESLAQRSAPVRCFVLWLLRRAEARAYGFACKTGAGAALAFPSTASPVNWLGGAEEAARLTKKFRALAAGFFALSRQAARGRRLGWRDRSLSRLTDCRAVNAPGHCSGLRHRSLIDTS